MNGRREDIMAEIKSTLDLIMERTKNLTLTEEEKAAIREKEDRERIRRLVSGCLDRRVDPEELAAQIENGDRNEATRKREILKEELIGRLDPERDNETILDLLEETGGMDTTALRALLAGYREERERERERRRYLFLKRMEEKGISGSALVSEPDRDPSWRAWLEERAAAFRRRAAANLKAS